MKPSALTNKGNGILRVLQTTVGVSLPVVSAVDKKKIVVENFNGIWDTGATSSVITKKVVKKLNLRPVGMTLVHTASGSGNQNQYLVNIVLPCKVMIQNVKVTEGILFGTDILIGMDIINLGDFSITNHGGITVMSYCMPSYHSLDFVPEINNGSFSKPDKKRLEREIKKVIETRV